MCSVHDVRRAAAAFAKERKEEAREERAEKGMSGRASPNKPSTPRGIGRQVSAHPAVPPSYRLGPKHVILSTLQSKVAALGALLCCSFRGLGQLLICHPSLIVAQLRHIQQVLISAKQWRAAWVGHDGSVSPQATMLIAVILPKLPRGVSGHSSCSLWAVL